VILASTGISHVSVCCHKWVFYWNGFVSDIAIFVLKRDVKLQLTTETAKHRITQTTPNNSLGTRSFLMPKISAKLRRGHPPNIVAKCRWGRLNAGVVAAHWRLSTRNVVNLVQSQVYDTEQWASTLFVYSTFAVMQGVAWVCLQELILVLFIMGYSTRLCFYRIQYFAVLFCSQ